jgi:crotonobetainyl-CoA:carnitine CoA-transferase CaiB-like acyl-CoA transferase
MNAFDDVRVLDCSEGLAGSMAAMMLADFGAQVLKLQRPDDDWLGRPPGHVARNRNKYTLSQDVAAPEARSRVDELLAGADVAVFDQGPAELARLGLDAPTLGPRHPRLVHLWTPPFGGRGRWSDLPAHHAMLTGLTGTAFRQGSYEDRPVWHVTPLAHYAQSILAAAAAGAALFARGQSGHGQAVTVSGLHAMAQTHCPISLVGAPPPARGKSIGGAPGYQLYQCADGEWLFLGTLLAHFFQRALKLLDLAGVDPLEAAAAIQAKLSRRPRDHWLALFYANDIPAAPVGHREDWLKSEIIRSNDLGVILDHPALGPVEMPGVGAKLDATPGVVRRFAEAATRERLVAFAAPRTAPAKPAEPRGLPLAGIRVLDLGTLIAGPFAASILANFGADVVKIEPPEGDPLRPSGGLFVQYNRGGRGLGLDLKQPAGQRLFFDLARRADVVMDNFRLGVRERLGITYEALRAVNPRIISCSANTYGSKSADARRPGFDTLLQARSGLMAAQGGEDQEPVYHTMPVTDVATAALSAFAVIAALNAREITGEGQNIETSLAAASSMYQFDELTTYAGRPPNPLGGRDCLGVAALDRYYACRDGWLTLACRTPEHFAAVARALDRWEWMDRWSASAAFTQPRDGALASAIAAALADRPRDEALELLTGAGVPAAPVLRDDEARRTADLWENNYYEPHTHPLAGELIASGGFAEFDGHTARFSRLDPRLGEHGLEVLTEYGVSLERIIELSEQGVIFRA